MHQALDSDVKALIEANVELSKRIIKHNTLPVFHRIEWLRRHKNKDNLSNLNAEINFTNEKISKLIDFGGAIHKTFPLLSTITDLNNPRELIF